MLKILVTFLIVPFLYSCQSPAEGQEKVLKNELAYVQVAETKYTKPVRDKQRKICDRLQKIRERLEKRKKRMRKRGK